MKRILPIFYHRSLGIAMLMLVAQQLIVASSTYFIARLADGIADGGRLMPYVAGFVASLIVVYLPAYWSQIYLEKAKFDGLFAYLDRFYANFTGRTTLYHQQTLKDERSNFIRQESRAVISDSLDYAFDGVALLLNIALNIIVLSVMIDARIVLAYALGFVLASVFVWRQQGVISRYANISQKSRIQSLGILARAWDNVLIGNAYNLGIFHQRSKQKLTKEQSIHLKSTAIAQSTAIIGMLIFMLPVIALTVFLFIDNQTNLALLAMLVATLPRQIQLLQMGQSLIYHQTNFASIRAKLRGLIHALDAPKQDITSRIRLAEIDFNGKQASLSELDDLPKIGRITITGDNGVGKTSLILYLKERFGNTAFYLPTKHELSFHHTKSQSTGQTLQYQLTEIAQHACQVGGVQVLLLDEWDANLDTTNRQILDDLLDDIAKDRLVIDIRHRH